MGRLLYEQSLSYEEYLIIPFIYSTANGHPIYSFKLLSAQGHRNALHCAENPSGRYSGQVNEILAIAQEFLSACSSDRQPAPRYFGAAAGLSQAARFSEGSNNDAFRQRYTYRDNLIILHAEAERYFYDHYPPDGLNNVAAPKIFASEYECLSWIKQGIDRLHERPALL